eukprot:m.29073 g.29073  ORF g.29073 m.29073 type:complete len:109 (-) comp14269_c1_seq1:40-366(-)
MVSWFRTQIVCNAVEVGVVPLSRTQISALSRGNVCFQIDGKRFIVSRLTALDASVLVKNGDGASVEQALVRATVVPAPLDDESSQQQQESEPNILYLASESLLPLLAC